MCEGEGVCVFINLWPDFYPYNIHVVRVIEFSKDSLAQKIEMNGVLGHDSALVRLYWAGDNLG